MYYSTKIWKLWSETHMIINSKIRLLLHMHKIHQKYVPGNVLADLVCI